jgi:hypothetical protein
MVPFYPKPEPDRQQIIDNNPNESRPPSPMSPVSESSQSRERGNADDFLRREDEHDYQPFGDPHELPRPPSPMSSFGAAEMTDFARILFVDEAEEVEENKFKPFQFVAPILVARIDSAKFLPDFRHD